MIIINWNQVWQLIHILNGIVKASERREKLNQGKRKKFTEKTKRLVLISQNYRCFTCGVHLQYRDFHHKGPRSDNSPSNCEALCPLCHAKKTRKKS